MPASAVKKAAKKRTAPRPETTLGRRECEARGLDYAETFRGHFILGEAGADAPDDWTAAQIGGWTLAHCPSLELRRITGPNGQVLALVLGVTLLPDGTPMPAEHAIEKTSFAAIEAEIESLAGRYVAIACTGGKCRLYVDPACSLVPFYDPDGRRVASCVPLVLDRAVQDNPDLPLEEHRARRGTFYLFGDTVDAHVRRMLANHYLDLARFEPVRHWPKPDTDLTPAESGADILDEIMELLRGHMEGLIRTYKCAFPITGGGDSRILLAAASNVLDDVGRFFVHVKNQASAVDSILATAIAERLNVPLQIISRASPRVRGAYDAERLAKLAAMEELRTSYQSVPNGKTLIVHDAAPDSDLILRGGLVEMTRLNKWRPQWGEVTPERGIRALPRPQPMDDEFANANVARYAAWMDGLPKGAQSAAVDLGHCELWLPTTLHTGFAGPLKHFMMHPFNDRRILQRTMRLSHRFRKSGRPQNYIMRNYLPELRHVPYAGRGFSTALSEATGGVDILKVIGRR